MLAVRSASALSELVSIQPSMWLLGNIGSSASMLVIESRTLACVVKASKLST